MQVRMRRGIHARDEKPTDDPRSPVSAGSVEVHSHDSACRQARARSCACPCGPAQAGGTVTADMPIPQGQRVLASALRRREARLHDPASKVCLPAWSQGRLIQIRARGLCPAGFVVGLRQRIDWRDPANPPRAELDRVHPVCRKIDGRPDLRR